MLAAMPGTVSSHGAGGRLRGHLIMPRSPQMPRPCVEGAMTGPRSLKLAGVSLWAWTPGWHTSGLPGLCGQENIRPGQGVTVKTSTGPPPAPPPDPTPALHPARRVPGNIHPETSRNKL